MRCHYHISASVIFMTRKFGRSIISELNIWKVSIGIDPEYQGKGLTAVIFQAMQDLFSANGITEVETNPELEENKAIQQLWKNYEHVMHKKRRTYKRDL